MVSAVSGGKFAYCSGNLEPVFSHHRLEALIARQISQLKGLDICPKKVYSRPNSGYNFQMKELALISPILFASLQSLY
jgi:hypothetical protein